MYKSTLLFICWAAPALAQLFPFPGPGRAVIPVVATPADSPGTGTYGGAQTITITDSTPGATICYTTNGTTPAATTPGTCDTTSGEATYSGSFTSPGSNFTLKAIATKAGSLNSGMDTSLYTIGVGATFSYITSVGWASVGGGDATSSGVNTTGANFLAVPATYYIPGGTLTIVDQVGACGNLGTNSPCNTWTALTSYGSLNNEPVTIFYAQNPTVGSGHQFKIRTATPPGYSAGCALAFSGAATSSVFDAGTDIGTSISTGASISPGAASSITAASESGTTVTLTTDGFIPFGTGMTVNVQGIVPSGYNGQFVLTNANNSAHTVQYTAASSLGSATVTGATVNPMAAPSMANELLITAVTTGISTTPSIGTAGWTIPTPASGSCDLGNNSGNNIGLAVAYQIQTASTAVNPLWNVGNGANAVAIAGFKP